MSAASILCVNGGSGGGGTGELSATLSRPSLSGFRNKPGTAQTSQSTTVITSGGTAPFTYLWEYVSGDADVYPGYLDQPVIFFYAYVVNPTDTFSAVWRCKVTDAFGNIAYTNNVTSILYYL